MANNVIEIKIIADAKGTQTTLKDTGQDLKTFGKNATEAGKASDEAASKTKIFGDGLKGLAGQLGLMYGLSEVVGMVKDFTTASIAAARESAASEAQLQAVLTSTGYAAGKTKEELLAYASSLQEVSNFSDEAVQGGQAMLLTFKNIKGDTFDQATTAILDMSQAMGTDLQSSAIQVGKALNDPIAGLSALSRVGVQFTEDQKNLIRTLVETGDMAGAQGVILAELESQFGGSAAAARAAAGPIKDLEVAYGDLQEEFGGLLMSFGDIGILSTVTTELKSMTEGAKGWQEFIKLSQAILATGEAADTATASTAKYSIGTELAVRNITMGALSAKQLESALITGVTAVLDYTDGWDELKEAVGTSTVEIEKANVALGETEEVTLRQARMSSDYAEAYKASSKQRMDAMAEETAAAQAAADAQNDMMLGLASSQANYYNELKALQDGGLSSETEFNSQLGAIRASSAEEQKALATGLSDELAKIEQDRADKIAWVMTGAHERTAEENAAALEWHNAYYDELTATAIAKSQEKTDAIIAEQGREEAAANAAREKEKAAMEAHLNELKLKTALSMLETTGQLSQLTGLVGISAGEAANLITAGVLPVTQELGLAIQGTMANMESGLASATATATANQALLQEAMAGTITSTDTLGTSAGTTLAGMATKFGDEIPAGITATGVATNTFVATATEGLGTLTETTVTPFNQLWIDLYTLHFPQLQVAFTTANQIMLTGLNQTLAVLQQILSVIFQIHAAMRQLGEIAKKAAEDMAQEFKDAASSIEQRLLPALKETIKTLERIEHQANSASSAISGMAGTPSSSSGGNAAFQHGTGGILTVPSQFRNDNFMIGLTGGEEFAVAPRGMSLRDMLGMAGKSTVITMTNNITTQQPAQDILHSLEIARAMIPA